MRDQCRCSLIRPPRPNHFGAQTAIFFWSSQHYFPDALSFARIHSNQTSVSLFYVSFMQCCKAPAQLLVQGAPSRNTTQRPSCGRKITSKVSQARACCAIGPGSHTSFFSYLNIVTFQCSDESRYVKYCSDLPYTIIFL